MKDPEIKVTRINGEWHARLYFCGILRSEMSCKNRADIGYICREMLRWHDKMGGESEFAAAARSRQISGPTGSVKLII